MIRSLSDLPYLLGTPISENKKIIVEDLNVLVVNAQIKLGKKIFLT